MARKSSAADSALRATLHRDALREEANALAERRPSDNRGGRLTKWEREAEQLGRSLERAERAASAANKRARIKEPAPAAPSRKRKPAAEPTRERKPSRKRAAKPTRKPAREEEEEEAPLWEIGVNYKSDRRASRVMVNIRIASKNGEPISRSQAQRVMTQLHNGATPDRLPENIEVTGVDWERPKWGGDTRSGDDPARDLYNFRYVLGSVPADEYRLKIPDEPFL